jgi:hypothetical protein
MKSRKFTRTLQYRFSKEEIDKLSEELTDAVERVGTMEARKKSITSQATAELDAAKSTQNVILGKRRAGYEFRDIECEETFDLDTRMATVIRLDTGEQIDHRPMTAKELQVDLPLESRPASGSREIGLTSVSHGFTANDAKDGEISEIFFDDDDEETEITE